MYPHYCIILLLHLDAQGTEKSVIGGTVGSVVFCVSASIITIVIAYSFLKWRTKKRSRNFQMDIFAKYVQNKY